MQSGCQPRSSKWSAGEGFKTQIIVSRSFGTEFQQVELMGVMDKSTLIGEIADFYYSPGDENGTLVGTKPIARFIEDDGVYIPADQTSLQMVTLYYHMQQLKKLELESLNSQESILKWPRKIALAVRVQNSPEMKYDNAFYNGKVDALYFVPYRSNAFPIPLNPGVIAHEHFHSYFSYQVINPLIKKQLLPTEMKVNDFSEEKVRQDLYNTYVLKIINEGLADVWGWIYSRDPDFVALSLPKAGNDRILEKVKGSNTRMKSEAELKNEISEIVARCLQLNQKCANDDSYKHGTKLARNLKAFAIVRQAAIGASDDVSQKMMAGKVLTLISEIQETFSINKTINLDKVLSLWEKQFDSLSQTECEILEQSASTPGVVKCGSSAASSAQ